MNNCGFNDWFCLMEGRKNFSIDPISDQNILLGNPEWQTQIDDRLRKSQLLAMPMRLVWWGQYGIGKTHRLRYMQFLVKVRGYAYHSYYLNASDIQEKTGFERLQYEMMNALGFDEMRNMVRDYFTKAATGQASPNDEICGDHPDVRVALEIFGSASDRAAQAAWYFLCGKTLDKSQLDLVGVGRPALERAGDYAAVIHAFATIIERDTGKQVLFLIDECENLMRIKQAVEARWNESLRAILDIKNLSIVLTVGAEKTDNLPVLILRPDIVRRIQKDNYVQMEAFKAPETQSFVKGLLELWIDPAKRAQLEESESLTASVNDYDPALYPFTKLGFKIFCEGVTIDPRSSKPSEILAKLNNVAAEAYFQDRRLITREHLINMGYA